MKRIFFICTMMLVCISGFSQKFTATDNLVFEEISETEFRRAYQTKNKNVFRWKKKGRQYKRTVTTFLDTDMAKRNVSLSESIDKLAWTMPSEKKRRLQYQRKASVVLCLCKNGVYHGCPSLIICFFVFLPHLLSYTVTPNHKKKEDATSLGFAFVSLRSA